MRVDKERIKKYLFDILSNLRDIESLLREYGEKELVKNKHLMKSLKYSLVEISEASSIILQHILAKYYGIPVKGYMDTLKKAYESGIITESLFGSLKPFFDLRNAMVHRYWSVDDKKLINMCNTNYKEFFKFIETIESFIEKI